MSPFSVSIYEQFVVNLTSKSIAGFELYLSSFYTLLNLTWDFPLDMMVKSIHHTCIWFCWHIHWQFQSCTKWNSKIDRNGQISLSRLDFIPSNSLCPGEGGGVVPQLLTQSHHRETVNQVSHRFSDTILKYWRNVSKLSPNIWQY